MTPEAKRELSTTIRAVRTRLLDDLHTATESVYRLSVRTRDAELPEAAEVKRRRLEAWIEEQVRAQAGSKQRRTADDFRREVEKQAAYTLLNRLVILRLLEAAEPRRPAVATGGWESQGYKNLREIAPALVHGDESEGYAFLLQLVFEDLATDLPGLYGPVGVADLVPIPTASLRYVIESLDAKDLATCWTDDMTLGWVYQYWNDPEREALDAKLNAGGKVEPHEIASKTQMFTERYMVDWLLQNSLGPMWLAMCRKHGWTPEVEADGTLERLEQRRADWRGKRDRGEVSLTELMPLHTDAERRWAYYVPQPIPEDAVQHAPESVRDLKILDPAVGSGHFLMVAFDLLVALYREEARQRASSSPRPGNPGRGATADSPRSGNPGRGATGDSPRPGTPGRGAGGEGHPQCPLAIGLKIGKFKPEYVGKSQFYCAPMSNPTTAARPGNTRVSAVSQRTEPAVGAIRQPTPQPGSGPPPAATPTVQDTVRLPRGYSPGPLPASPLQKCNRAGTARTRCTRLRPTVPKPLAIASCRSLGWRDHAEASRSLGLRSSTQTVTTPGRCVACKAILQRIEEVIECDFCLFQPTTQRRSLDRPVRRHGNLHRPACNRSFQADMAAALADDHKAKPDQGGDDADVILRGNCRHWPTPFWLQKETRASDTWLIAIWQWGLRREPQEMFGLMRSRKSTSRFNEVRAVDSRQEKSMLFGCFPQGPF